MFVLYPQIEFHHNILPLPLDLCQELHLGYIRKHEIILAKPPSPQQQP